MDKKHWESEITITHYSTTVSVFSYATFVKTLSLNQTLYRKKHYSQVEMMSSHTVVWLSDRQANAKLTKPPCPFYFSVYQ